MDKSSYEKFVKDNQSEIDELKSEMDNDSVYKTIQSALEDLEKSTIYQKDVYSFLTSVAMEECGELIQAISKLYRSRIINYTREEKTEYNIHEEIADVLMNIYRIINVYELDEKQIMDILVAKAVRFRKYAKECRDRGSFH